MGGSSLSHHSFSRLPVGMLTKLTFFIKSNDVFFSICDLIQFKLLIRSGFVAEFSLLCSRFVAAFAFGIGRCFWGWSLAALRVRCSDLGLFATLRVAEF